MNKKKIIMAVLVLIIVALCLNVFVQQKFIKTYTFTELEYRGYTAQDVSEIEIKHSYLNRILSYNEWRISVEFVEEPNVLFWFTYRDGKIIFQGVTSEETEKKNKYILVEKKAFVLVICFVLLLAIAVATYGRKQSGVVSTSELPTDIVNLDEMETFALDSLVDEE